jgi:hypothetical protein
MWVLLAAGLASAAGNPPDAAATEYEVKAAFLYKFASFVEWPGETHNLPIGICVLGQDPFGDGLDRAVKGKTVNGRPFKVRRVKATDPLNGCGIVFVSASERGRLTGILSRLEDGGALTVGDVPGFCERGGIVNFDLTGGKVGLEINVSAAEKAGLQLSSKLLSLARIVRVPAPGAQ